VKKYIIDTNALISFVTDRSPVQQETIAGVFEDAARLRCVVICPQHVMTDFVFVMDKVYQVPKLEISGIVRDFIAMPGIELQHEIDFPTLLALWPSPIQDFGDAIVAAVCKSIKGSSVITFDARFIEALKKAGIATRIT